MTQLPATDALAPAGWGRSLGLATELAVLRPASIVEDRGDHLVVRTPGQPGYYWGNFLAFREPPGPGDEAAWPRLFEAAFGDDPAIRHMAFGWDDPEGGLGHAEAFEPAGFEPELGVVLTARAVQSPPHPASELVVRALASDADWEEAIANQVATRAEGFEPAAYMRFKRAQMAAYRAKAEAGQGAWFGGFVDGRLVADLGLYMAGTLGRFQSVGTHPSYRRRGACGTLVHAVAAHAFAEWGAERLVIVAEPGEAGGPG